MIRSVGTWKVPTFSARDVRSAALDVDGANGSCTWQMSSGTDSCIASIVRVTSTGSDGEDPRWGAGLRQHRAGIAAQGLARGADGVVAAGGRHDEHPVPACGERL